MIVKINFKNFLFNVLGSSPGLCQETRVYKRRRAFMLFVLITYAKSKNVLILKIYVNRSSNYIKSLKFSPRGINEFSL